MGKGTLPKYIYYFCNNVSEGQYATIIKHKLVNLKKVF